MSCDDSRETERFEEVNESVDASDVTNWVSKSFQDLNHTLSLCLRLKLLSQCWLCIKLVLKDIINMNKQDTKSHDHCDEHC